MIFLLIEKKFYAIRRRRNFPGIMWLGLPFSPLALHEKIAYC